MSEYDVRVVLDERVKDGRKEVLVAWENSWQEASSSLRRAPRLCNFELIGVSDDSSDVDDVKELQFVIRDKLDGKAIVWPYDKLKTEFPELLLEFYEATVQVPATRGKE